MDSLTPEMIRGFDANDLQAATENLEVAIFDSPPFDKPNEIARRRSLALAYFLKDDPSLYPSVIPNAKEVLRQLKGDDAEMQYVLGVAMLGCYEGRSSQAMAVQCIEKALEMKPDYAEAREALEKVLKGTYDAKGGIAAIENAAGVAAKGGHMAPGKWVNGKWVPKP